jgi:polyisoprenoid-binding protein YceI
MASEIHYAVTRDVPVSSMIRFSIPYSMGVHQGAANAVRSQVVTDENDRVLSARFSVPIDSMVTGNSQRDCHLREALGIDYSHSVFPKEHVCDSRNQMPTSGPDSVQYSDINVEFEEMSLPSEPLTLGVPQVLNVKVRFNIHGIEKVRMVPVSVTKTVGANQVPGFRIVAQFDESLKDYGVQVKPFSLGFFKISVKDTVTVQVALNLVRM